MRASLFRSLTLLLLALPVGPLACGKVASEEESPEAMAGAPGDGDEEIPEYGACPSESRGFAESVVEHEFGEEDGFGHDTFPESVLGAPQGGGCCMGSLEVTSLGDGGWVILGFGERSIVDGKGADFIVFENAFQVGGDEEEVFAEPALVEVSEDGSEWLAFPCSVPDDLSGCAGLSPVYAGSAEEMASPFEPGEAGGDAFDLADVGLSSARFLRITDIPGDDFVFDLDAVSVVNGECAE